MSIYNTALGREVWESISSSSSLWTISTNLQTYANTTYRVNFKNLKFLSEEDKKNNKWSNENAWINLSSYNDTPIDLAFTVQNIIPSDYKNIYLQNPQWYWLIDIDYTTTSGQHKYFRLNYCTSKYNNSNSTYQDTYISDNGTQSKWESTSALEYRRFRILFNDNTVEIYDKNGDNLAKTIYGVKNIRDVRVGAGPGTELEITNTSCQKMTILGQALPYLNKATNFMDNNNASAAASEMTTAINKGLKCYETYLIRGIAYYRMEYYKSAIEDFTSAISYPASNKEQAYCYRGFSKLALDDDYGINDLRNGGQDGIVFLRENNLLNYTPGQSKKKTTPQNRNTTPSKPNKPALKK